MLKANQTNSETVKLPTEQNDFCSTSWFGIILFAFLIVGYFKVYSKLDWGIIFAKPDTTAYPPRPIRTTVGHVYFEIVRNRNANEWLVTIRNNGFYSVEIETQEGDRLPKREKLYSYGFLKRHIKDEDTVWTIYEDRKKLGMVRMTE